MDKPTTSESVVEFKFPSEKLSSLKLETSLNVLASHGEHGKFSYTGVKSLTYNGDKKLKAEVAIRHTGVPDSRQASDGNAEVTLTLLDNAPLTVATSYKCDPTGELKKGSGTLDVKYGKKAANLETEVTFSEDLKTVKIEAKATTPIEKFRNVELKLHRKKAQDDIHALEIQVVADNAKYTLDSQVQLSPSASSVSIVLTCPSGKTELISKFKVLPDNVYVGKI